MENTKADGRRTDDHIHNPIEWGWDQLKSAGRSAAAGAKATTDSHEQGLPPASLGRFAVNSLSFADLKAVLKKGFDDFGACRTDVIFLCIVYPVVGLVLARVADGAGLLPLVFPLASGFALLGPLAGMGLYEMSRRRERGEDVSWASAFGVLRSPRIGAILSLGALLAVLFACWVAVANVIYDATLGPAPPESIWGFVVDVFSTSAGWTMIAAGCGVGFLFALVAMTISVIAFPMLLDREVGVLTAVTTSIRAVMANPVTFAAWGIIVALGLVLGSIPALLGLVVVLPVLGHATWHLYRRAVGDAKET